MQTEAAECWVLLNATLLAPAQSDNGTFDFRPGEARCVLRADRVDEPSSREENQSDHHFLQKEATFTGRASIILWSPWQHTQWWVHKLIG